MWPHTATDATLVVDGDPLSATVYRANNAHAQVIGTIGRVGLPDDSVLVFPGIDTRRRTVHSIGVRAPLRVWWILGDRIQHDAILPAWTGMARDRADYIVELPPSIDRGRVGDAVALR